LLFLLPAATGISRKAAYILTISVYAVSGGRVKEKQPTGIWVLICQRKYGTLVRKRG
jgi:hypothetical protein